MSELVITPNFTKKTARFHGAVAAGEHAAVRILGAASLLPETPSDSTLRLRVLIRNPKVRTLAVFPFVTAAMVEEDDSLVQDVWGVDGDDLTCTLNLNTAQALRRFRRLPEMEVLAVLDDPIQRMMHFSDYMLMRGWPQEPSETPIDLDNYRDFVAETKAALAAHSAAISENASAIAAEQTARENADANLTSGIGSVSEVVSTKADAAALAAKQDAGDYATRQELGAGLAEKQDAGDYLTEHQSLEGLVTANQMNAALAEKANNSDLDDLATKEELEAEQSARQVADAGHDADLAAHENAIEDLRDGIEHAEEHITNHALDNIRHVTAEDRLNIRATVAALFAEKNYDLSTTDGFVDAFIDVVETLGGTAHD